MVPLSYFSIFLNKIFYKKKLTKYILGEQKEKEVQPKKEKRSENFKAF
jgi:hypothetical protein